ncbi:MAG: pseudouridine synthase, partial [Calditrichaeota bacterium]|nr:pseudouridine synthase [Calditrichota bacterium]
MDIVNIAAYKFVDLPEEALPELRDQLLADCERRELLGTILLSSEGINLILAGAAEQIDGFKQMLSGMASFQDLEYKESRSSHPPFKRMWVKIKKEIITMNREEIRPAAFTGPRISAQELKRWLDEGREFTLLDTRNDYEVRLGSFAQAEDLHIASFRQFPEAVEQMPSEARDKPLVMFCTGGIRCEKASPLLLQKGFREVYQLDGGILKYFEAVGDAHFRG